ncbi:hypothetical protein PybrP1_001426 [[Pythium] brassicae (nom. inval.)]|nr:hypothetical protein PybrP1_001426 [[Pythium] brassicae (nom. inval.)]
MAPGATGGGYAVAGVEPSATAPCIPGGADAVPGAPTDCLSIHGCVPTAADVLAGWSHGAGAGAGAGADAVGGTGVTRVAVEITGFSPSCCMNELYSSSIATVSAVVCRFCTQSRVGWLESPHIAHLIPGARNVFSVDKATHTTSVPTLPLSPKHQPHSNSITRTLSVRALPLAVALLATDVAKVVVAQRAVDPRELAQLLLLVLVLRVVHGHKQALHLLCGALQVLLPLARDEHVQVVVLVRSVLLALAAFLHRAFPADRDLAVRLLLHALLRVPARADDQPNEVVLRELLDRDVDLALELLPQVVGGRPEQRVHFQQLLDHALSVLLQRRAHAHFTRVCALATRVVLRRRRRRPRRVLLEPRGVRGHGRELQADRVKLGAQQRRLRLRGRRQAARGAERRRGASGRPPRLALLLAGRSCCVARRRGSRRGRASDAPSDAAEGAAVSPSALGGGDGSAGFAASPLPPPPSVALMYSLSTSRYGTHALRSCQKSGKWPWRSCVRRPPVRPHTNRRPRQYHSPPPPAAQGTPLINHTSEGRDAPRAPGAGGTRASSGGGSCASWPRAPAPPRNDTRPRWRRR